MQYTILNYPRTKDYRKRKEDFFDRMSGLASQMDEDEDEEEEDEKLRKNLQKYVDFGPSDYGWANPALKIIHDELSQYYKNGKLRVWFPKSDGYWEGYDYPHKYDTANDPNGIYFLSEIEKFIEDKYGISDELFYDFIIENSYVEGRYWEKIWHLEKDTPSELKKSDFGRYGMEPTENITHMLNILELDFGDEISGDSEGFPIYVDYFKKLPSFFQKR